MFYNPYDYDWYEREAFNSYIRVLNASPALGKVDVFVDGRLIAKDLGFKEFSWYMPAMQGNYRIEVFSSEDKKPVLYTDLYLPANNIFNGAIIGEVPDIKIYPIPEPYTSQKFGRACIRFINLSPDSAAFDVSMQGGTKIFNNVTYTSITNYACIPAGNYNFTVSPAGKEEISLSLPAMQLTANNYYTIYALGKTEGTPNLEALLVMEPRT